MCLRMPWRRKDWCAWAGVDVGISKELKTKKYDADVPESERGG